MRIFRFVSGVLVALWTAGVGICAIRDFGAHSGTRFMVDTAADVGVFCLLLAATIWLFSEAFSHPKPSPPKDRGNPFMFRFTIRELVLVTVIVAMGAG